MSVYQKGTPHVLFILRLSTNHSYVCRCVHEIWPVIIKLFIRGSITPSRNFSRISMAFRRNHLEFPRVQNPDFFFPQSSLEHHQFVPKLCPKVIVFFPIYFSSKITMFLIYFPMFSMPFPTGFLFPQPWFGAPKPPQLWPETPVISTYNIIITLFIDPISHQFITLFVECIIP